MTHIFDSLKIKGYRGFQDVNLSGLGQVNIFVGDNNSGKTSLLEAISILCSPLDPFRWLEISQRRLYFGRTPYTSLRPDLEAMKWIFPQNIDSSSSENYQGEILIKASGRVPIYRIEARLEEIYGVGLAGSNRGKLFSYDATSPENDAVLAGVELQIAFEPILKQGNLFSSYTEPERTVFQFWEGERFIQRRRSEPLVKNETVFPSYSSSQPILQRFTRISLRERKQELLELLRYFDDKILDIEILTPKLRSTLYIKHQELGFAPLYVFGDGFKRTLMIALNLLSISNGVLLIDEIETSIHVSVLSKVFSWLIEACRQREIQLFVTTHSLEAVDAMLQSDLSKDDKDDIVAFRLNLKGQAPQRFSGDLLYRLRFDRGLDVR